MVAGVRADLPVYALPLSPWTHPHARNGSPCVCNIAFECPETFT